MNSFMTAAATIVPDIIDVRDASSLIAFLEIANLRTESSAAVWGTVICILPSGGKTVATNGKVHEELRGLL